MASIYCPDCNRQAGDNWTECYLCGGKNLKEGEPSLVTSKAEPVTSKKARRKAQAEKERKAQIICPDCKSFGITKFLVRPYRRLGYLSNISDAFDAMVNFVGKLVGWSLDNECYYCGGKILKEGEPSPVTSKKARRKANKDGYPDRPRRGGKRGWIQFCLFMFGLFGVIVIVNLCNYAKSL